MSPPPSISVSADMADGVSSPAAPRLALPLPATDNASLAIGLVVASTVFFAAGDVAAKLLTATLPAAEVTWLRYVVFALLVVPVAFAMGGRRVLRPSAPVLQVLRGAAVAGSGAFFIFGLHYLEVAQATAINYMSPIFITALSIPLLGERVGPHRWAAAAFGFVGVMMVVRPGGDSFTLAALLPIAAAMSWGFAAVITRKMSAERPATTLAWSAVVGLLLLSVIVPPVWRTPTLHELAIATVMGVCSTTGHGMLVLAFRKAAASALAPFSYVQILFAGVLGYLFFSTVPGPWTIAGGAVIAASGLYTAHRERTSSRAPKVSSRYAGEPHAVAESVKLH